MLKKFLQSKVFLVARTLSLWKSKNVVRKRNVSGDSQIQNYLVFFNIIKKFLGSTVFHRIAMDLPTFRFRSFVIKQVNCRCLLCVLLFY